MLNARKTTRITPYATSPTVVPPRRAVQVSPLPARSLAPKPSTQFPQRFEKITVEQVGAEKHHYLTEDGRKILDVSGGAAVSCFGPGCNDRIADAIFKAYKHFGGYSCSFSFTNSFTQAFIDALVQSAGGYMEAALLYGSGESLSGRANVYFLILLKALTLSRPQQNYSSSTTQKTINHNGRFSLRASSPTTERHLQRFHGDLIGQEEIHSRMS